MLRAMQMAVRPASVSRQACAPAAVPVAIGSACAAAAQLCLKQVSEAKNWCQLTIRFEAAQEATFLGSNVLRRSNLAKPASCLVGY